jgi:hypothetical protein
MQHHCHSGGRAGAQPIDAEQPDSGAARWLRRKRAPTQASSLAAFSQRLQQQLAPRWKAEAVYLTGHVQEAVLRYLTGNVQLEVPVIGPIRSRPARPTPPWPATTTQSLDRTADPPGCQLTLAAQPGAARTAEPRDPGSQAQCLENRLDFGSYHRAGPATTRISSRQLVRQKCSMSESVTTGVRANSCPSTRRFPAGPSPECA